MCLCLTDLMRTPSSVFVVHWGPGGWDWCSSEQRSAGVVPLKLRHCILGLLPSACRLKMHVCLLRYCPGCPRWCLSAQNMQVVPGWDVGFQPLLITDTNRRFLGHHILLDANLGPETMFLFPFSPCFIAHL